MRTNEIKLAFVLVLLFSGTVPGFGLQQQLKAEKRTLIKELFDVSRAGAVAESTADAMLGQMEKTMPQLFSQILEATPEIKPKDQAELQKLTDESRTRILRRMRDLMREKMDLAEITEQMFYPLYDKYFNEDELRGLIAFYKSPVGQKSLDVLPALMQEALAKASDLILPKLTPIITQVMDEEKEHLRKSLRKQ